MNEFITYLEAEKILAERIQACADEIAQWVFDKELSAYANHKFNQQPFVFRPDKFINNDDYMGVIYELWFKLADIETFQPKQRYISRQALLDAGARYLGDEAKALRVITSGANGGYLPEYHPIHGWVEIEGDLFRSGLFDVANVMEYPGTKDWLNVHADKAPAAGSVRQSVRGNVRTRKINLVRAIESAALKLKPTLGKKPSLDELWQYFETDQDETGFIEDYTDTHLTWRDTRGKLKDTPKSTVANHLSRIKF